MNNTFCKNCGAPVAPGELSCRNCGVSVTPNYNSVPGQNSYNNMMNSQPVPNYNNQPVNNMMNPQPVPSYNNQPVNNMINKEQDMSMPAFNQAQASVVNNPQVMNQPQKKNNKGIIVLVIAVVVALLVIGGTILLTNKKDKPNNESNVNSDSNVVESNSNEKPTPTPVVSKSKVRYQGYEFNIPTDYLFEIRTSSLLISDNINWAATIEIFTNSYTTLKNNTAKIKSNFIAAGYTAADPSVKEYGGKEMITIEVEKGGSKAIVAYTQSTATQVIGITAYTKLNSIDYTILDKVGGLIKESTYVGTQQSIINNPFSNFTPSKATK